MSDEHQAKALGSVNHPFVKTPNLDKLLMELILLMPTLSLFFCDRVTSS